jgi:hypothetical protein
MPEEPDFTEEELALADEVWDELYGSESEEEEEEEIEEEED